MELSPTGFALLAQIAREPINAYGLTLLMRKNLHYVWPRAESRIYSEVVRLEEAGLIVARAETVGRRARRVMSVTARGRAALGAWLAGPVTPGIAMESEAVLRVFFGALGARDDLLRALDQVRAEAEELLTVASEIGHAYLDGAGPAPEQIHLRAMAHSLLTDYALLLRDWASDAQATASAWRDLDVADKQAAAARTIRATLHRLEDDHRRDGNS